MRKIYLFLLALCVSGVSSIATAQDYAVDASIKDANIPSTLTDKRHCKGVSLQAQKSSVVYGDKKTIWFNDGITNENYTNYKVYNDLTGGEQKFQFKVGQTVNGSFELSGLKDGNIGWDGTWMGSYIYLDVDKNGIFATDATELLRSSGTTYVAHTSAVNAVKEFRLPQTEGTYRMRFKTDWQSTDPMTTDAGAGGSITDVLIDLSYAQVAFTYDETKGTVTGTTEGLVCGEDYTFTVTPKTGLYASATVICGEQETVLTPNSNGTITVPAAVFQNDLTINVEFGKRVFTAADAVNGECYFRLKNKQHGTYLKSGVSTATATANAGDGIDYVTEGSVYAYTWNPTDATETSKQASYIWKIEGGYLTSQSYRMDAIGTGADMSVKMSKDGKTVTVRQNGETYGFTTNETEFRPNNQTPPFLHAVTLGRNSDNAKYPHNLEGWHVAGWTEGADASQWYIEPVEDFTTVIGTGGWSSINYAFPVSLPAASVTAYTVASEGNGFVELAEIPATDGEILLPSNTPAFIEGTEGETVTVTILLEEPEANITKAEGFKGTTLTETKDLTSTEAVYGIATVEGVTALYKMQSGTTIPCNKAYYETTASGVAKFELNFGETTGIDTLAPAMLNDNTLYDLNGRRVLYPTRGIYVTASGRKIYVK